MKQYFFRMQVLGGFAGKEGTMYAKEDMQAGRYLVPILRQESSIEERNLRIWGEMFQSGEAPVCMQWISEALRCLCRGT